MSDRPLCAVPDCTNKAASCGVCAKHRKDPEALPYLVDGRKARRGKTAGGKTASRETARAGRGRKAGGLVSLELPRDYAQSTADRILDEALNTLQSAATTFQGGPAGHAEAVALVEAAEAYRDVRRWHDEALKKLGKG